MPRKGFRKIEAPDFEEGSTTGVPILPRHVVSYLLLRTLYDFDVTGGTGSGDILGDAAFRVPAEITVQADGSPLHNFDGRTAGVLQRLFGTEEYAQTDPTTDAAGTSEADRESVVPIPFFMPHSKNPDEFALPTPRAKARLQVRWMNAGELVDGEDGDVAVSNVAPELYEAPVYGVPAEPYAKWGAVSIRKTTKDVGQDGEVTIKLDHLTNGQELRMVLVEGLAKGTNDDEYLHDDAVVTEVGPLDIDDREEFEAVDFAVLQNRNKVEYGLAALETGVAVLDAAEDRRTSRGELWLVSGDQSPFLKLRVAKQTNDTKVVVTTLAAHRGAAGSRGNGRGR